MLLINRPLNNNNKMYFYSMEFELFLFWKQKKKLQMKLIYRFGYDVKVGGL